MPFNADVQGFSEGAPRWRKTTMPRPYST